jgi:hypothetical protein
MRRLIERDRLILTDIYSSYSFSLQSYELNLTSAPPPQFVLQSFPYPLPHSTPVTALQVVGIDELIVGYKNGRVEFGGEAIGWSLVREGSGDGEGIRQVSLVG